MAKYSDKNPNSIAGNFFVDNRCIGCASCESFDADTFTLTDGKAYVKQQPTNETFTHAAIALLSCPVDAIGVQEHKDRVREVKKTLPLKLHDDVYFCSFNAEASYGANSYLIVRESGNILVDCPKFTKPLLREIEKLGGLAYVYLTHKDDIGEYAKFREYFNAQVIFHEGDFNKRIVTADIVLRGEEDFVLDDDAKIIPVPGHTKGHTVLLYKNRYLFSGDHLAYKKSGDYLYMFENYCWYDWNKQLDSLDKLLKYDFACVYAGHGASYEGSVALVKEKITNFLNYKNYKGKE